MAGRNQLQKLSDYLKDQLQKKGIDRFELARLSGVSDSQVWRLLNKLVRNPKVETLEKIANALKIDSGTLTEIVYPNWKNKSNSSVGQPIIDHFPSVESLLGRQEELRRLSEYSDRNQLVFVVGFVGIGKSSLIRSFVRHISEKFEDVLLNPEMSIAQIINLLKEDKRYLVILDNLDTASEEYIPFLNELVKAKYKSCVIVTSQERPKEYLNWDPRPRLLELQGLEESAAIALLQGEGLSPQTDERLVKLLIQKYEGNPWGLKLALQDILELYDGDLASYLGKNSTFTGKFSQEIKIIIERLTPLESEVLYWLALRKVAIPYPDIRDAFTERNTILIDGNAVSEAVQELNRRVLLRKDGSKISLRTTVQICAEKKLQEELFREIRAIAANSLNQILWLYYLDLTNEQIKLRARFSRYENILMQALNQLQSKTKEQNIEINNAIANLQYLLGK
ncbi:MULTISPECIES: helix-turn-helix domain-containing protein [Pseudanabaena]|uniref:Helix-turn-helix domain protein n=2 Tax=Pseudanabaena TaxID=1152 RepID=L8N1T3_9CYAN|nr:MULTISPECIES: helix-turn-helix domain-containing protein [Pseudanabaena]ELS34162.1 helix-turn-helix domain protein [Pseudanabaena biceps PCC 7429]MDG3493635.1 helix-turn-helix domain-containing protein [Pseudanabaena catenata USMAC16]